MGDRFTITEATVESGVRAALPFDGRLRRGRSLRETDRALFSDRERGERCAERG